MCGKSGCWIAIDTFCFCCRNVLSCSFIAIFTESRLQRKTTRCNANTMKFDLRRSSLLGKLVSQRGFCDDIIRFCSSDFRILHFLLALDRRGLGCMSVVSRSKIFYSPIMSYSTVCTTCPEAKHNLSRQILICRDKSHTCRDKFWFVATNLNLSRQIQVLESAW